MGIINSNKIVDTTSIDCDETFKVTLSLTAAPNITENPVDIVLILDRSGSMSGTPLSNLKKAANKFIDIIDEATDSSQDGEIGDGSRIGIVSFASTASQDTQLITSVSDLKVAVNNLTAGGLTNHAAAFEQANELFKPASGNAKIMVMFTDGKTTAGPDASPYAATARAEGVTIYVIGLLGSNGIDEDELNDWASKPSSSYVVIAPSDDDLENIFEDLAKNITKPGATDIVIDETLESDFEIVSIVTPVKGTATKTSDSTIRWTIDELGVSGEESATLIFEVKNTGAVSGVRNVNKSVDYSDNEGNSVVFPSPTIAVDCSVSFYEECSHNMDATLYGCNDTILLNLGEMDLQSQGRIVMLNVRLNNICPNKRVAVAMTVNEIDENGMEHPRGLKTFTVPAHTSSTCRDIEVSCVKFILPEDLDVSSSAACTNCSKDQNLCNDRLIRVRSFAHYVDTDFECCDSVM